VAARQPRARRLAIQGAAGRIRGIAGQQTKDSADRDAGRNDQHRNIEQEIRPEIRPRAIVDDLGKCDSRQRGEKRDQRRAEWMLEQPAHRLTVDRRFAERWGSYVDQVHGMGERAGLELSAGGEGLLLDCADRSAARRGNFFERRALGEPAQHVALGWA